VPPPRPLVHSISPVTFPETLPEIHAGDPRRDTILIGLRLYVTQWGSDACRNWPRPGVTLWRGSPARFPERLPEICCEPGAGAGAHCRSRRVIFNSEPASFSSNHDTDNASFSHQGSMVGYIKVLARAHDVPPASHIFRSLSVTRSVGILGPDEDLGIPPTTRLKSTGSVSDERSPCLTKPGLLVRTRPFGKVRAQRYLPRH
jgi:hypothetical protein